MKLYSVFSLYVIKIKDNYFICRETLKDNVYVEFFTKEKITVKKETEVERLSEFYSLLEVMNYETSEPLRLNKKQILHKYLEINKQSLNQLDKEQVPKRTGMDIMIEGWQNYISMLNENGDIPDIRIVNVKELKK